LLARTAALKRKRRVRDDGSMPVQRPGEGPCVDPWRMDGRIASLSARRVSPAAGERCMGSHEGVRGAVVAVVGAAAICSSGGSHCPV